jgi:hypothetical protein
VWCLAASVRSFLSRSGRCNVTKQVGDVLYVGANMGCFTKPLTFKLQYKCVICHIVMTIKITVFWDVKTCRLIDRYKSLGGLWRLLLRRRA